VRSALPRNVWFRQSSSRVWRFAVGAELAVQSQQRRRDDGTRHSQLQPALSSAGTDEWVLSWRLNEASDSSGDRRGVGSRFQGTAALASRRLGLTTSRQDHDLTSHRNSAQHTRAYSPDVMLYRLVLVICISCTGSPLLHFFSFYACVLYELRLTTSK